MSDRPPQSLEAFRQESLLKRNWILFWSYIKITSLVLGGGYAIIAAAQEEFVRRRGWLTDDDVVEMITITQTVPGILACNSAIYVGWRIGGYSGALSALAGSVLPSLVIIMLIAAGVDSIRHVIETPYVQGAFIGVIACIVGMVVVTALKMRKKAVRNVFGWCVAIGCFVGLSVFRISPAWLIVAAIAAGLIKVGVGSALKKIHPEKGEAAQ
ncbi:chromate transporter [Victivallis vadensis]|uniref:chromate transporter n=1 Tax=Victivallis vadensis TaxID=172901 RepID=UPI001D9C9D35|nr:chromate transporter [Victivallis vadensis]HJH04078.1 chromate transporter [Victivallis vadensis]